VRGKSRGGEGGNQKKRATRGKNFVLSGCGEDPPTATLPAASKSRPQVIRGMLCTYERTCPRIAAREGTLSADICKARGPARIVSEWMEGSGNGIGSRKSR